MERALFKKSIFYKEVEKIRETGSELLEFEEKEMKKVEQLNIIYIYNIYISTFLH